MYIANTAMDKDSPIVERDLTATIASAHLDEIRRLGLAEHLAELETLGLTVLPPEKVASPGLADRLKAAILRVAEQRSEGEFDPEAAKAGSSPFGGGIGAVLYYLLGEDPAFQEAVQNPCALALARHMLGERAMIGCCMSPIKAADNVHVPLHSDNYLMPSPFPAEAYWCNVTWALTDYADGEGPLVYVPGSHRMCRHPAKSEELDFGRAVPAYAKAGSIIIWHGNTWHGALPRTAPGVRMSLQINMCRPFIRPQEMYREYLSDEVIAANPPGFAELVGRHFYGWTEQGGDSSRVIRTGPVSPYE